jgi:hypothetical protein
MGPVLRPGQGRGRPRALGRAARSMRVGMTLTLLRADSEAPAAYLLKGPPMRKFFALPVFLVFLSCGGEELTPVEACNQIWSITCDKFFNCFTPAQKEAAKGLIGLSAADCRVKFQGASCNADKAKCDSGKVFKPGNAEMCLDQLKTLSCNDITAGDDFVGPAICDQTCQ